MDIRARAHALISSFDKLNAYRHCEPLHGYNIIPMWSVDYLSPKNCVGVVYSAACAACFVVSRITHMSGIHDGSSFQSDVACGGRGSYLYV